MCSEETSSTGFLEISTQCSIAAQIEATRSAGNVSGGGRWSFGFVWSSLDGDIFLFFPFEGDSEDETAYS
jgi:hypothetical protein